MLFFCRYQQKCRHQQITVPQQHLHLQKQTLARNLLSVQKQIWFFKRTTSVPTNQITLSKVWRQWFFSAYLRHSNSVRRQSEFTSSLCNSLSLSYSPSSTIVKFFPQIFLYNFRLLQNFMLSNIVSTYAQIS